MKVPIEADWKSPCTVLVERAFADTEPDSCFSGGLSGIRSTKLVSIRLNAVVCEFAMLPEMFSSANDCARRPVTAVVSAPKIPIPSSDQASRTRCAAPHGRNIGLGIASRVPRGFALNINTLYQWPLAACQRGNAGCGRICRATRALEALILRSATKVARLEGRGRAPG